VSNPTTRSGGLLAARLIAILTVVLASAAMAQPVVTLTMDDDQATEAGPTTEAFTVARTGATGSPLTVALSGSGTATWNQDWSGSGGSFFVLTNTSFRVTIPANQLSATVTFTPVVDPIVDGETDEDFTFTLASPSVAGNDYLIGAPDSGTFTIIDYGPLIFKDGLEDP
jgi:hypothetical protein